MISIVPYTTFLQTVQATDLAMLTSFVVGVEVFAGSDAEADSLEAQADRLFAMGLLVNVNRTRRNTNDNLPWSFTALVTPQVPAYVMQLARERVTLSRDPVPAA